MNAYKKHIAAALLLLGLLAAPFIRPRPAHGQSGSSLTGCTISFPTIVGGTIDNAVIGSVTPVAMTVTTFTATGLATFSRTGANAVIVSGAPQAAATNSLVTLGPTAIAAGVAGGTFLGCNTAGAFDFLEYELSGVQKFNVSNAGALLCQAATVVSINKLTLTAPATAATLTLANNKTFTVNNTITLAAGADGQTFTFPAATATIAGLATTQAFTAPQTISGAGTLNVTSTTQNAVNFGQTAVTQGTSNTTTVVSNTASGVITSNGAYATGTRAAATAFTVTCAACASTSVVIARVNTYSGTIFTNGVPDVRVGSVANGSFTLQVLNTDATNALNGTISFSYVVL